MIYQDAGSTTTCFQGFQNMEFGFEKKESTLEFPTPTFLGVDPLWSRHRTVLQTDCIQLLQENILIPLAFIEANENKQ